MPQTAADALKAAHLYSDDQEYALLRLPVGAVVAAAAVIADLRDPFAALLIDKDEITLVLPADTLPDFARRLPGHTAAPQRYRLITFDVVLEPTLTGFMAALSRALADAGVPLLGFAAYSRDHILVPVSDYTKATAALQKLQAGG